MKAFALGTLLVLSVIALCLIFSVIVYGGM